MIITIILNYCYRIYNKIADIIRNKSIKRYITPDSTPPNVLGKIYIQVKKLKTGKNVTFYPGVYLWGNDIEIGDNVEIGIGTIIYAKKKVKIGSNSSIAGQCYIIDTNHGTKAGTLFRNQPDVTASNGIIIGEDVWIGAQCAILKGSKINDGVIIGAQSLVNSEIPNNAIIAGCPAKVIKYR